MFLNRESRILIYVGKERGEVGADRARTTPLCSDEWHVFVFEKANRFQNIIQIKSSVALCDVMVAYTHPSPWHLSLLQSGMTLVRAVVGSRV